MLYLHPYLGEDEPKFDSYFSDGLVQPPARNTGEKHQNTLTTSMDGEVHTEMIDTTDLDDFMNTFMQPPKTGETVGKNTQNPVKRWVISVILGSPRRSCYFL